MKQSKEEITQLKNILQTGKFSFEKVAQSELLNKDDVEILRCF